MYMYIRPLKTFMGQKLHYRQAMKHNAFMMDHVLAITFIATFGPQVLVYEGEPYSIGTYHRLHWVQLLHCQACASLFSHGWYTVVLQK